MSCHCVAKHDRARGPGHLLQEINTLPSSFSECNGLDITSPAGHYSPRIINPSYCVCVRVFVCAWTVRARGCLHMYVSCGCVCIQFGGGCTCAVWGNLSPGEKVIQYLYTLSAGSSQAAVNLNYAKPLPLPRPPSPPLPCHRWQWTKLTAHCCVPRLTIGFGLSLRRNGHVGVLPFVWAHGGVLPLHHAAPPQGALGGLG